MRVKGIQGTAYPVQQVIPVGPAQVKLLGPDPPYEEMATVVERGRSISIQPRSEDDKPKIRGMAKQWNGPSFPIKALEDTILEANLCEDSPCRGVGLDGTYTHGYT